MLQEGKDDEEEHSLVTRGSENRRQRGERRPAGASRRRMHFWLQRGARRGRRCIGAGEELIRAFLASPFSLPQRRSIFPPLLPICLPSVVPSFHPIFPPISFCQLETSRFLKHSLELVFICQLVVSSSFFRFLLSSSFAENVGENPQRQTNRPDSLDSISRSSLVTDGGIVPGIALFSIIIRVGLITVRK